MAKQDQKRKHKRRKSRVAARIQGKDNQEPVSGFTRDISRGGLFIQTHHPLPPGTEIQIELLHKDKPTTTLQGVVVRASKVPPHLHALQASGMGVKLVEPEQPAYAGSDTPRTEARIPSSGEALVFFGSERHVLTIRDLSVSGAALVSPTPLPEISFVRMHFKLGNSPEVLEVDGVPIRSKPLGAGSIIAIRFLDPPDDVITLLDDFVRNRSETSGDG